MVNFCQKSSCTDLVEEGSRYCERHGHKVATAGALRVLEFVRTFTADNHYPPTVSEMCAGLGIASKNTVAYYLKRLEAAGLIVRDPGIARGLKVVEADRV